MPSSPRPLYFRPHITRSNNPINFVICRTTNNTDCDLSLSKVKVWLLIIWTEEVIIVNVMRNEKPTSLNISNERL